MDIRRHFLSKNSLAEKEISEDAPALILFFNKKSKGRNSSIAGFVMATCVKADITRFAPIKVRDADDAMSSMPFVLVGVGNVGDLDDIVDFSKELVHDIINAYGSPEALSLPKFKSDLTRMIRERYNNVQQRAFGIEIAVLSFLTSRPEIHRVKYNGEYHPCENYAVLGGYMTSGASKQSTRKLLLAELASYYKNHLPTRVEAEKIVADLLEKYTKDTGEMIHSNFTITTKKLK